MIALLLKRRGPIWSLLRIAILLALFVVLPLAICMAWMTTMPGKSASSSLPPPSPAELALQLNLRRTIETLCSQIGERNMETSGSLERTLEFLSGELSSAGYKPERQKYLVNQVAVHNLIAQLPGTRLAEEVVIVGAHYDSVFGSPGADDNASGVAAALALACQFAGSSPERTLRFVFFVNEESPYGLTPSMGSYVYAAGCKKRKEKVVAMLSLESLGYYSDQPDSQQYPVAAFKAVYPSTGNFITFIGDLSSRPLVRRALREFRSNSNLPSEGAALPRTLPGVSWSDHWSFWVHGYQAIMITGTAPFRNPHYHMPSDTPATLDYNRMARVVVALKPVINDLTE